MISPNKALTNAHVIYSNDHGGLATKVQVIPGKKGPTVLNNPFHSAYTTNILYPTQYAAETSYNSNSIRYDWAVLKLDENIGNDCGWLNLQAGGITIGVDGPDYHLSGYPVHNINYSNYSEFQSDYLDKHYSEYQFYSKGKILSANLRYMEHSIDMLPGQSGSPIYTYDNSGNVKVVAINAAEEPRYFVLNYAKAITNEIINTASSF